MRTVFHDDVDAAPVAYFVHKAHDWVVIAELVRGWVLKVGFFVVGVLQVWTVTVHQLLSFRLSFRLHRRLLNLHCFRLLTQALEGTFNK